MYGKPPPGLAEALDVADGLSGCLQAVRTDRKVVWSRLAPKEIAASLLTREECSEFHLQSYRQWCREGRVKAPEFCGVVKSVADRGLD